MKEDAEFRLLNQASRSVSLSGGCEGWANSGSTVRKAKSRITGILSAYYPPGSMLAKDTNVNSERMRLTASRDSSFTASATTSTW